MRTTNLIVNWHDDTTTIERSNKVVCESLLENGAGVIKTVGSEMWRGSVESVWGQSCSFLFLQ